MLNRGVEEATGRFIARMDVDDSKSLGFIQMPIQMKRYWYAFLKDQDVRFGVWSCKAMQLRGYSPKAIHPKHLFDDEKNVLLEENLKPGLNFLDIGSGVGTECIKATKAGASLSCGVEYDFDSLLTASERSRASKDSKRPHFFRVDLETGSLPFRDNSFDIINFTNVLEHLISRIQILKELKRVKKEKGEIILSVPNADTTWKKKLAAVGLDPRDDDDHKIEYSKKSLLEELEEAGLTVISDFYPSIPSFPWNGIIAMSAAITPRIYKKLQKKKREYAQSRPEESIGWFMRVK